MTKLWFEERRLGMFIHWGVYAVPGVQEQYWQRWNVGREEYVKYAELFNPVDFDAAKILDIAQEAGMEYLCFTTKHHDGFCMWDTQESAFNIMNTPYNKDILAMLAAECHKRNFPLELYYSVLDWHHKAYPNLGRHHEIKTDPSTHDMAKYIDFVKAQITELCSNYGKIHGWWWDMNVPKHVDESVNQLIRDLQPNIIINDRGFDGGDFTTPERDFDPNEHSVGGAGNYSLIEACQSVGVNSWGYRKEEDYFTSKYFKENIDTWLAKGCNYLLNVGPDALGNIPPESATILKKIGVWFKRVREGFEGKYEKMVFDENILTVRDGNNIYVHVPKGLESSTLDLGPLTIPVKEVTLLNSGESLDWTYDCIVYKRGANKDFLRLRNIPAEELNEPLVIKIVQG